MSRGSRNGTGAWGVAVSSEVGLPSPMTLVARTRTAYGVPSVSPVIVCAVPVSVASAMSAGIAQLSDAVFHWTVYPVRFDPPFEAGACQETLRMPPLSPCDTRRFAGTPGTAYAGATAWVAALVSDSAWPASSVNATLTLIVSPRSSAVRTCREAATPSPPPPPPISVSAVPLSDIHR